MELGDFHGTEWWKYFFLNKEILKISLVGSQEKLKMSVMQGLDESDKCQDKCQEESDHETPKLTELEPDF